MFDRIAQRYDALNRLMSLGLDQRWRAATIASLELASDARLLDVATGTGDVAMAAASCDPTTSIVGIDPSSEMLAIAKKKIEIADFGSRIELREGTAEELPFEEDSFDAATIAFGIRNVPDRARGLREISRVVKADGRIAILEAIEPATGLMAVGSRFWVHHLIPSIGALLSGKREYRYLQSSIAAFPRPSEFEALMRESAIRPIQRSILGFGACCLFVGCSVKGQA